MHNKDIIKTITITICVAILCIVTYIGNNKNKVENDAKLAYQVYLNGENLGLIDSDQALYDLINNEQNAIKEQYNVDNVYPPNNFYLMPVNTYNSKYNSVKDVYDTIAVKDDFTIKGYIITIKYKEEDEKEDLIIRVLDKEVFEQAIKKFILAFVSEEDYENYINSSFEELNGISMKIDNMYFDADISIKEGYVSIKEKIFTDVDDLSQFLLFGPDAEMTSYVVKSGDDIESVSEAYKLNPEEFIIANPSYRDEKVMLKVGDKVNVTLLNPVIDYVYEVDRIEDTVVPYTKQKTVDKTKASGYSEITQVGVAGLTRNHEKYLVKNGEQSSQVDLISSDVIREPVNEITIVGSTGSRITGSYVDIPGDWGWPTNQPSRITSRFSMRWGKLHEGIDISGTGEGSPIYSIGDGVVLKSVPVCKSCSTWSNGNYIVIQHADNYYSLYAHLSALYVTEGQTVSKGDKIGAMGHTGYSFGTHLHLSLFYGVPYAGGKAIDPMKAIYNQ